MLRHTIKAIFSMLKGALTAQFLVAGMLLHRMLLRHNLLCFLCAALNSIWVILETTNNLNKKLLYTIIYEKTAFAFVTSSATGPSRH